MAPEDAGTAASAPPLLQMVQITKEFPGVRALDRVDFAVRAGEIHALLGENGAGKSTLLKVLTGVYRRDGGKMRFAGQPISPRSPLDAQRIGISPVYQEVNLIPNLSVAENVCLGREQRRLGLIRWQPMRRTAQALLQRLQIDIDVTQPLHTYSVALQQMVAIARALSVDARLLILDEPTASLDQPEVEQLFRTLRRLRDEGLGIIFVTHFLDQVYNISDRLTVLRNGQLVGTYPTAELPQLELVAKMIGQSVAQAATLGTHQPAPRTAETSAQPFVAAQQLGQRGAIAPTSLQIQRGEIVGLAGLLGSGRTEFARLLFGLAPADQGTLRIGDREGRLRTPREAIAAGAGFCPEDRKVEGIIPGLSVRENIALALQARRGWLRALGGRRQRALAQEYVDALRIATPDLDKPVGQLSGGNQQKVVLARWLAATPRFLIVDEPTRGIDVGAKAEIEKLIGRLSQHGMAILFISSELEEVVRNCHRVLVLRDRQPVGELAGDEIDLPRIMHLIAERTADAA